MRTASLLVLGLALSACGGGGDPDQLDADYIVFGSSASTVTIAWERNPGASSVTIERGSSDADLAVIATLPAATGDTSYLDTGLAAQTAYTYRFTTTLADGSTVVEPIEHTSTTAEQIVITHAPPAIDAPVIATVGAAGAAIAVDAINATVVVPPGAAQDGTELTIQPVGSPFVDDPDIAGVEVTTSAALAQPIDVVFSIDDLDAVTPDNLAIAVQADDGSWISQAREVDADAHTITFTMTPDPAAAPAVWAAPRTRAGLVLRETFILPRMATVKVKKTLGLTPYGRFTNEKGCDDIETEALCLSLIWAGRSLTGAKKPVVATHPLPNIVSGYQRTWLVERVIGGSASVGTITAGAGIGATYTAPGAAPSFKTVEVQFTSVDTRTHRTAYAMASRITIQDPGSVKITAKFRGDDSSGYVSCPFANTELWDTVEFAITLDDQLQYHVDAIQNYPTEVGEMGFYNGESGGWNTEPEVFTMSSGYAIDYNPAGDPVIAVVVYGTSVAGDCYLDTINGPEDGAGYPHPPMFHIQVNADLSVTAMVPHWTFTAQLIESQ
jgi:hypothetical protein